MKKKIYYNRIPVNGAWGGGNIYTKGMHTYTPDDFELVSNVNDSDLAFIAGYEAEAGYYSAGTIQTICINTGRKYVVRVNDCDARKGTAGFVDSRYEYICRRASGIIWVSNWIRDYYYLKYPHLSNIPSRVIVNGVEDGWNRVDFSGEKKLKRIITHHWSDNRLKGDELYSALAKLAYETGEFEFKYIGRLPKDSKVNLYLDKPGGHVKLVSPLSGIALYNELAQTDADTIYASWSTSDPGPNHIIESLAVGLPTYVGGHGGGCVEFAGDDHVIPERDPEKAAKWLAKLLTKGRYRQNLRGLKPFHISSTVQKSYQLCREIIQNENLL